MPPLEVGFSATLLAGTLPAGFRGAAFLTEARLGLGLAASSASALRPPTRMRSIESWV
ncbi:MAG: hypothetical protein HYZ68_04655 [Chloroflexi bacterium]|nr:hypothetical protein [Chloroflexota bacterium]